MVSVSPRSFTIGGTTSLSAIIILERNMSGYCWINASFTLSNSISFL